MEHTHISLSYDYFSLGKNCVAGESELCLKVINKLLPWQFINDVNMKKAQRLIDTSEEFTDSSDDSGENDENLEKVGLDILRLPAGEFRRPKQFVESTDSSEDETTPQYNRFCELEQNAKVFKLGRRSKENERGTPTLSGRYQGDTVVREEDRNSSDSSDLACLDESQVPDELKKWADISMYPEHVVERLIQYVPRDSSEDLSDLDMVITRPMFFPERELRESDEKGIGTTSRVKDYDFCRPGCRVGKTVDQPDLILKMDQSAMIKELKKEMEAMGADNFKKYFSSDYFTKLFEKQIVEAGIDAESDTEDRDEHGAPKQQEPSQQRVDQESTLSQSPTLEKRLERRNTRKSTIGSFKNVEILGGKNKKVTESLLRSTPDHIGRVKSSAVFSVGETSFSSSILGEESRDKLSAIPEETSDKTLLAEYEEKEEDDSAEEGVDERDQLNADGLEEEMSSHTLGETHLSELEKAWLMFLKVNLEGLEKRPIKVKPVKSNVRQQFKNKKDTLAADFPSAGAEVPILEPEEETNICERLDLKIEEQFKAYKEGEMRESLAEFGVDEEFGDVLKKIPAQRPSAEMIQLEKEVDSNQSDSSLINSDEMDEINATFAKNVIVTPDLDKINKLIDIPHYLVPPNVRAPIKIGSSLQEAQEKMFASMKQNYFSTRVVYVFEFEPKKLSHENLTLMFRDYVMSQNAGYRDVGLLAGCLFTYSAYGQGIVMVEGGEYQITRHFADLKATDIYLSLKKSRILFVHTYIQEQYLKKWIFVSTHPPIGTDTNEPILEDERAKENLLLLTDKLNILFQHLEQREKTIDTNCAEIDLPNDVHLKLPAPQLIDFILDYYALRPLHIFIEEIYSIPDTYDSSEDEQIFPEDVPYYAIQPGKHELSDILDYMVEDKSLTRKRALERDVRKKMEAEGKQFKSRSSEDEHDVKLMYDIDDTASVRQLDVDTIYVEKFDEAIKAKLKRVPYGKDLEGYERIRRFKERPELIKTRKKKKKKKKMIKEEVREEAVEEEQIEEIGEEETVSEMFDEEQPVYDETWLPVGETTEPKEKMEPPEEIYGEIGEEGVHMKRKPYKNKFRYYPEYKVPYREVGPAISASTASTARTLGLEDESEIEREDYEEQSE